MKTILIAILYGVSAASSVASDWTPDWWWARYGLSRPASQFTQDTDGDGWSDGSEYAAATSPVDYASRPQCRIDFTFSYRGSDDSGDALVLAYRNAAMDGTPMAIFKVETAAHRTGGSLPPVWSATSSLPTSGCLREGEARFFAFLDRNGNGAFDAGEPAGMALYHPLSVRIGTLPVRIPLTDRLTGWPRFSWPSVPEADMYFTVIKNVSIGTAFTNSIATPRRWLFEQDQASVGGLNLGATTRASYTWDVHTVPLSNPSSPILYSGGFTNDVSEAYSRVSVAFVSPSASATIAEAIPELRWSMDARTQGARIAVTNAASVGFINKIAYFPERVATSDDPVFSCRPQLLDGGFVDLPDGTYTATVTEYIRNTFVTATKASRTFVLDRSSLPTASGSIAYSGALTNRLWFVQALSQEGGAVMSQTSITNSSLPWVLRGLAPGEYHFRAWTPTTGVTNAYPAVTDPQGWVMQGRWRSKPVSVRSAVSNVVVRAYDR